MEITPTPKLASYATIYYLLRPRRSLLAVCTYVNCTYIAPSTRGCMCVRGFLAVDKDSGGRVRGKQ